MINTIFGGRFFVFVAPQDIVSSLRDRNFLFHNLRLHGLRGLSQGMTYTGKYSNWGVKVASEGDTGRAAIHRGSGRALPGGEAEAGLLLNLGRGRLG
jgi:hypothetical protein